MAVVLETQETGFIAQELWALPAATDVTAVLILQVSERTALVAGGGPALLGPGAAPTDLAAVGVRQEAEGAVQGAASQEAPAQLLPAFALTSSTAIVVKLETGSAVLLCQGAVGWLPARWWINCDVGWFFADGAALPRHLDGVHAALPADRGHAVGLPIDALAESAVVFPPPVSMGEDLAVGIAAGGIIEGIHRIFAHWAALSFGHVVPLAVQLPALGSEADGDTPLASAEPTLVQAKHVPVVILHVVEYAGWLCFINTFKDITALSRSPIATGDYAGNGSHLTHGETT